MLVVLDSLLQAQGALINARLVQLDKEVAKAASLVIKAENRWISCTDPAEKATLKEVYNNRMADKRQLVEERRDLERKLTGAMCPLLEWFCACLLAVNRSIKGACALGHKAA